MPTDAPVRVSDDGERLSILKALCCPEGCVRVGDCWADNSRQPRRLERTAQCDAILKFIQDRRAPGVREEALEEAAKEADRFSDLPNKMGRGDLFDSGYAFACAQIAESIRALKSSSPTVTDHKEPCLFA